MKIHMSRFYNGEICLQEIERRRAMMRQRAHDRKNEETEVMEVEEEGKSGEDSESESEYEEYTDSEDEAEPRLKPVFIRKWVGIQSVLTVKCEACRDLLCISMCVIWTGKKA